jgi:hypothetical protein
VPREVDIVLNEHSEVFSTAQKCRPGREEWGSGTADRGSHWASRTGDFWFWA